MFPTIMCIESNLIAQPTIMCIELNLIAQPTIMCIELNLLAQLCEQAAGAYKDNLSMSEALVYTQQTYKKQAYTRKTFTYITYYIAPINRYKLSNSLL